MSKITKLLAISIVLLLVSCSRPEPLDEPTAEIPTSASTATSPPPQATVTPALITISTQPPAPTLAEPIQQPAPPTADIGPLLAGDRIPLLPGDMEIFIQEIHMVSDWAGWGISSLDPEGDHILITRNGGEEWMDVTPPQPILDPGYPMVADIGIFDLNTAFVHYKNSKLVWTTKNGGTTWQPSALTFDSRLGSMFGVLDSDHAWLFQFLDGGMNHVYTALARTTDGGQTWSTLLDPYTDGSIQSFDKTGTFFINPSQGWLTRAFRGVAAYVDLDITSDGGESWEQLSMPAPPTDPGIFKDSSCACGLYDPVMSSPQAGNMRLSCGCFQDDGKINKNYFYQTDDGGAVWTIYYVPEGELHTLSDQVYYLTSRDIYRSTDGGMEWDLIKSVNWDGQFSFVNRDLAWAVAYDSKDDEYALVKTTDGCETFEIVDTRTLSSPSIR